MQPTEQIFADRSQMSVNGLTVFIERVLKPLVVAAVTASFCTVRAEDADRPGLKVAVLVHQSGNEAVLTTPLSTKALITDDRADVSMEAAVAIGYGFHSRSASETLSVGDAAFASTLLSGTNGVLVIPACTFACADETRFTPPQSVAAPDFMAGGDFVGQTVAKTAVDNGFPSPAADRHGEIVGGATWLMANAGGWFAGVVSSVFHVDPLHNPYSSHDMGPTSQKPRVNELKPARRRDGRDIAVRSSIADQRAVDAVNVDAKFYALIFAGIGAVGFMVRRML